jgi:hypothetical protein
MDAAMRDCTRGCAVGAAVSDALGVMRCWPGAPAHWDDLERLRVDNRLQREGPGVGAEIETLHGQVQSRQVSRSAEKCPNSGPHWGESPRT